MGIMVIGGSTVYSARSGIEPKTHEVSVYQKPKPLNHKKGTLIFLKPYARSLVSRRSLGWLHELGYCKGRFLRRL